MASVTTVCQLRGPRLHSLYSDILELKEFKREIRILDVVPLT